MLCTNMCGLASKLCEKKLLSVRADEGRGHFSLSPVVNSLFQTTSQIISSNTQWKIHVFLHKKQLFGWGIYSAI